MENNLNLILTHTHTHTHTHIVGQEDPLEKGMATHSCILAWRIPQTEEPGGLQSIGSQRAGHTELVRMHSHAYR